MTPGMLAKSQFYNVALEAPKSIIALRLSSASWKTKLVHTLTFKGCTFLLSSVSVSCGETNTSLSSKALIKTPPRQIGTVTQAGKPQRPLFPIKGHCAGFTFSTVATVTHSLIQRQQWMPSDCMSLAACLRL